MAIQGEGEVGIDGRGLIWTRDAQGYGRCIRSGLDRDQCKLQHPSSEIEAARLRLAEAMLSIATEGNTDVAALKIGALRAMALDYRSGIRPTGINPSLRA